MARNQNHTIWKNILLVDCVIDLCSGLSYMTFAVAGRGRCAVIASAAGTKLRNKCRRRRRRKRKTVLSWDGLFFMKYRVRVN